MLKSKAPWLALCALAACGDGQPFFGDEPGNETVEELPGTEDPEVNQSIQRFESVESESGGLVTEVVYDAANDQFAIDNLGFDGANVYSRSPLFPDLGGYRLYRASFTEEDALTGDPIEQIIPYLAIVGESDVQVDGEARTFFTIVRTGGFADFGPSGFVFERRGGLVLAESGQAQFTGGYAGVRVFQGIGGVEYTTGDMRVAIDFEDFNANPAVQGEVSNRRIFDAAGNEIAGPGGGVLPTPNLPFVIVEGATSITEAGEIGGEVANRAVIDGQLQDYETGQYFGILAGDMTQGDGGEVVGVIRVTSEDPRFDEAAVIAQETGGFIVSR